MDLTYAVIRVGYGTSHSEHLVWIGLFWRTFLQKPNGVGKMYLDEMLENGGLHGAEVFL
jgi:hypothetical protein